MLNKLLQRFLSPRCPTVAEQDAIIDYLRGVTESELFTDLRASREFRYMVDSVFQHWRLRTQIRVIREARGWTQKELAERAGMKQSYISSLENIYVPTDVTVKTLQRLARAMDVRLSIGFTSWGELVRDIIGTMSGSRPLVVNGFEADSAFKPRMIAEFRTWNA